jgi:putative addiction module component (TIGR02574 family)
MQKTEVLEELPHLTRSHDQEIPLAFAKLNCDESLDDRWLTADEKALLDRRLAAYIKDPSAGCSWDEVESRLREVLSSLRSRPSTAGSVSDKTKSF